MPISIYPPTLQSTQPAFLATEASYDVKYTLQKVTSADSIKHVQIRVVEQRSNSSVVNTSKYPDNVIPWHMTYTDYMQSKSSEGISGSRLSSLNAIENPVLKETSQYLCEEGHAGYQENILEEYEKDLPKCYQPDQK